MQTIISEELSNFAFKAWKIISPRYGTHNFEQQFINNFHS